MASKHSNSQSPKFITTPPLEYLRSTEFSRLDRQHHIYVDYTGSALYPESILQRHQALLRQHTFGNPHSENPTSDAATRLVENARQQVLSFFRADTKRYTVIFTANASTAIKLVAESFPFTSNSQILLTADNHNSVNGIREYANRASASTCYVPLTSNLRIDHQQLMRCITSRKKGTSSLFAYPAQSNFSGVKHPLSYVATARNAGWFTLLDCAAYAPTSRLDLSTVHPDFVPVSFYKMFGYPTGVGALIARKTSLQKLRRPWFAGGTVAAASVMADAHQLSGSPTAFEDGTVDFLNIAAVPFGLRFLNQIGMSKITTHVSLLTSSLLKGLLGLRHFSGRPIIRIHGPKDTTARGGTIALDVLAQDGNLVDPTHVDRAAAKMGISLRVGCFCNPGASEHARGVDSNRLKNCVREFGIEKCLRIERTGAVRLSLGIANTRSDVVKVLTFFKQFGRTQVEGLTYPGMKKTYSMVENVRPAPARPRTQSSVRRRQSTPSRHDRFPKSKRVGFDLRI